MDCLLLCVCVVPLLYATMSSAETQGGTLPKALMIQPYLLAYGAAISLVSPAASAHQLLKLFPKTPVPTPVLLRTSLAIFPHQTLLKTAQMNLCTPAKEYFNPWAAFAVVGVLQGCVYGQANVHFTR